MTEVYDEPHLAPADYATMDPCVDIADPSAGWGFPEYAGSGVPLEAHPFQPLEEMRGVSARCAACGSQNTLCIYLHFIGSLGTGKDMTVELVCQDCGKYTVRTYID